MPTRTDPAPPRLKGDYAQDAAATSGHLLAAGETLTRLPARTDRTEAQRGEAAQASSSARTARLRFLAAHGEELHRRLTDDGARGLRLPELAYGAAESVPGLVPTRQTMDRENALPQAAKEGHEADQGILFWGLLRGAVSGSRLVDAMLRPTARALHLLDAYQRSGSAGLGTVRIDRRDGYAEITVENTAHLNSEDNVLADDLETAVDLVLLDDDSHVGVLRGGVMDHPRYVGRRVFSSGINLTHLYNGRISLIDFLLRRELGYISKIVRGLRRAPGDGGPAHEPWTRTDKPWVAAVDTFAIGGGMQLLMVFDHVVAESGAWLSLPAAREGIVPGAANHRLSRMAGHRLARRIVLGGRRIEVSEPEGALFCDEVVDADRMDEAVRAAAERMGDPSVVANRRMLNLADEPAESFRAYMAEFSLEQSSRIYSRDVLDTLEKTWMSRSRRN
ncbi:(3,5-dihydroxyphenyl)acetyl-CoA 1,2-dioxygenase DpgC [Streptomyces iconiensis]|uniref:Enoyl-CoA hydratase/isomerase family protein n=1 Tax=Streptomyces iconiensis TaxID=1384038 RepID=A0ABT7A0C9_9ACTN|nr:(3,5-dihydroxyphenyl)acetyl-CoA 1,2-dioxygenase DpgC [Streptomyces iconiensis]MDJ1134779.1 enoyl-CoA hydratase/isomerase family protein [Streptomyces iconiensis]